MGLQRYPLGGFLGGMNLVDNPYALANNEARNAKNIDLGLRDVLNVRKGFSEGGLAATVLSQTKTPGKVEEEVASESFPHWTSLNGAKTEGGEAAQVILGPEASKFSSNYMKCSEYGFSLPANAVPVGILATFRVKTSGPGSVGPGVYVNNVNLMKAGLRVEPTLGGEGSVIPVGAFGNVLIGGSETSWYSPTKAQVEATNFGVGFRVRVNGTLEALTVQVDLVSLQVFYIVPGAGTDVIDHMRPWYTGTARYLMISANGKIKRLKEGTVATLFTGTAGTTWMFEPFEWQAKNEEVLICMNGVDAPRYINQAGEVKELVGTKKVPNGTMIRVWKGRLIVSGVSAHPQRVYESEPFNPIAPDDETNGGYGTNYVDIGTSEEDIEPMTWMELIDDVLLLFKKRTTWAIYTDAGLANYRIANVGCEGRFLSCVLDDRAYFTNRAGVYSVTAEGNPRYESYNLEPSFKGEAPLPENALNVDLSKLSASGRMAARPDGRICLVVAIKGFATPGLVIFEGYPRLRGASSSRKGNDERTPWVWHEFAGATRQVSALCVYRTKDEEVDNFVAGLRNGSTNIELVKLFTGTRDGLTPINWKWRSGEKGEITEEPFERIRRVNLLMRGKIKAKVVSDIQTSETATLESPTEESVQRFHPETWGRYHYLELWETESQLETAVYAAEFAFRGGKEH